MKTMNKLMFLAVVVMGCVVSTADLQAMRKRNAQVVVQNDQQKKQKVETKDHKDITSACSDIKKGLESKKITPKLFLAAATKIAEALKKLKQEEPDTCITIKDVINAFFNYFISASIFNAQGEQQTKSIDDFYSLGEQLIGVEGDDNLQRGEESVAPIFYGSYPNYNQIMNLLQEIFGKLCERVENLENVFNIENVSAVLEKRTKEAHERLVSVIKRNDDAKNTVQVEKQDFQKLVQDVNDINVALRLKAANFEEEAEHNEAVASKVKKVNEQMKEKATTLKQLLNK
jgi:peptidoglycan hydrolase CwlO-like protein